MGMAEVRYDMAHGAPRRLVEDALERFASTVPPGTVVFELGSGHYDHRRHFPEIVRLDLDRTQRPDVVGDAHALPIASGSVEVAVSISVLEHVADPYQVVREWFRIMRPGGRLFAWVPFFFGVHGFPGDVSRFTREGLEGVFERAGFEVERSDADTYAGLFLNISDAVHFVLPRSSGRRVVRGANRALFLAARAGFVLDRRLKLSTLYAGTEIEAVKPRS